MANRTFDIRVSEHQLVIIAAALKAERAVPKSDMPEGFMLADMIQDLIDLKDSDPSVIHDLYEDGLLGIEPAPIERASLPVLDERDLLAIKQVLQDAINANLATAQNKSTTDKERGDLMIWFKVLAHIRAKFN